MRLTIRKAFLLTHACGRCERWHSISPTSIASIRSWPWGEGSILAGLTVCFLWRCRQTSGLKWHLTIWRSWPPTTRPCFSSSRLPTWPSRPPLVLSPQPTRNLWMRRLVQGDPWQGLRREGHGGQKSLPGNYCWKHGHRICKEHTSATCTHRAVGHRADATSLNILDGSEKDKCWSMART
jgi:hypothetical protein